MEDSTQKQEQNNTGMTATNMSFTGVRPLMELSTNKYNCRGRILQTRSGWVGPEQYWNYLYLFSSHMYIDGRKQEPMRETSQLNPKSRGASMYCISSFDLTNQGYHRICFSRCIIRSPNTESPRRPALVYMCSFWNPYLWYSCTKFNPPKNI